MTDQPDTLGPESDNAVDLNPDRCAYTNTLAADDGRIATFRCTARASEEHEHRWSSDEQGRWTDETLTTVIEAMDAEKRQFFERYPYPDPLEEKRAELRRFARILLGPLYTAADVEGAIAKHLAQPDESIHEEWCHHGVCIEPEHCTCGATTMRAADEDEPLPDRLREIARERRLDADGIAAAMLDEAADALEAMGVRA